MGIGASGQTSAAQFIYGTQIPNGQPVPGKINQQTGVVSAVAISLPNPLPTSANDSAIDPSGSFLYMAAQPGLFAFSINRQTGALTQMANSPFSSSQNFASVAVDQLGKFVYAYGGGQVFAYSIQAGTGQLTPVPGAPFGAGPATGSFTPANSIAVDQTDKFLYVSTSTGIVGYTINPSSGALSMIAGSPFGTAPQPMAVVVIPSNQFLYETSVSAPNVYGYSINQNTGALTEISGSPFSGGKFTGGLPDNMTMASQGKFLYVANLGTFSVNPSSGALGLVSNFVPGDWPVIDPTGNFLWALTTDQNCWHCDQGTTTYQVDPTTGNLTAVPNSFFVMQNSFSGAVVSLVITK